MFDTVPPQRRNSGKRCNPLPSCNLPSSTGFQESDGLRIIWRTSLCHLCRHRPTEFCHTKASFIAIKSVLGALETFTLAGIHKFSTETTSLLCTGTMELDLWHCHVASIPPMCCDDVIAIPWRQDHPGPVQHQHSASTNLSQKAWSSAPRGVLRGVHGLCKSSCSFCAPRCTEVPHSRCFPQCCA